MRQRRREIQLQSAAWMKDTAGCLVTKDVSWEDTGEPLSSERVHLWSGRIKNKPVDCSFLQPFIGSEFAPFLSCVIATVAIACMCPPAAEMGQILIPSTCLGRFKGGSAILLLWEGKRKDVLGQQTFQPKKSGVVSGVTWAQEQLGDHSPWILSCAWFGPLDQRHVWIINMPRYLVSPWN